MSPSCTDLISPARSDLISPGFRNDLARVRASLTIAFLALTAAVRQYGFDPRSG